MPDILMNMIIFSEKYDRNIGNFKQLPGAYAFHPYVALKFNP